MHRIWLDISGRVQILDSRLKVYPPKLNKRGMSRSTVGEFENALMQIREENNRIALRIKHGENFRDCLNFQKNGQHNWASRYCENLRNVNYASDYAMSFDDDCS
ncbi:hypothetical protein ACH5RR_015794 [Cinchona calisaya]|uniref:Uncharacterized protein n=1 Tax=Cinchona calisaya TaxID=153742 RepID=A0ABD2ZXK4_9GENT